MNTIEQDNTREQVRAAYGAIAKNTDDAGTSGCLCCSPAAEASRSCCGDDGEPESQSALLGYSEEEMAAAPAGANLGLGCGNPVAVASIRPGETVLDLGSGAGFDCFIAARQLGASGRVIGVDMTPAMVSKARRNAARTGYANVEFRLGEIEALPVADASVDLVISNCVINLSPDKPRVFREAFRVLKPGGRLSIADVVARRALPKAWLTDPAKLTGCVGGAETAAKIEGWLAEAGFVDVRITPREQSRALIDSWDGEANLGDYVVSAVIEGRKP